MHTMIQMFPLALVFILTLWNKLQVQRELRVCKEGFYTSNDVAKINFECLALDHDFLTYEVWPSWKLVINNFVQIIACLV